MSISCLISPTHKMVIIWITSFVKNTNLNASNTIKSFNIKVEIKKHSWVGTYCMKFWSHRIWGVDERTDKCTWLLAHKKMLNTFPPTWKYSDVIQYVLFYPEKYQCWGFTKLMIFSSFLLVLGDSWDERQNIKLRYY